jgi:hypothetical protein
MPASNGHARRAAAWHRRARARRFGGVLLACAAGGRVPSPVAGCRPFIPAGLAPGGPAGLVLVRADQGAADDGRGDELIAAEFARAHPARRAARQLLGIGPVVGSCWAAALVTGRAWTWPVPVMARIAPGLALVTVIILLAVAARSTRYRSVGRAGAAGSIGTVMLDALMIIGVMAADPAVRQAAVIAAAASAARIGLSARLLCPVLTRG